MRRYSLVCLVLVIGLVWAGTAAADQATEAKAMVEKAVAMAKAKGMDNTFKAIRDRKGGLVKGEVYVFAGDLEKTTLLAHPFAPEMMIGSDMSDFKDRKGQPIFVLFGKMAKDAGQGWIDYLGRRRSTGKDHPKRAYIMRVPGTTVFIGCAYYPE
jgi:signal transduction histidine kinase